VVSNKAKTEAEFKSA
jgi:hypothetical protein